MAEEADQQAEAAKKVLFMKILDGGARARLNNIRFANPEFAEQVELLVMQLVQSGKVRVVDEKTLIALINRMRGPKKEMRITRK
jgi:DNA-binding TFAR19-related protein (PDSD5 family)